MFFICYYMIIKYDIITNLEDFFVYLECYRYFFYFKITLLACEIDS